MTTEIKVGQRWSHKFSQYVATVLYADKASVLLGYSDSRRLISPSELTEAYDLMPDPKTRPIAKGDIMKMLAVNPVLYTRRICDRGSCHWRNHDIPTLWIEHNLMILDQFEYSHNPFAPNPVIVGPEIEVVE